jgi:hypothetical protein
MSARAKDLGDAEGWWLSERADGFYQIQKFDEDPAQRFSNDGEAHAHVRRCAAAGSILHIDALLRDGRHWQFDDRTVGAETSGVLGW